MAHPRILSVSLGRLLVLGALVIGTALPAQPAGAAPPRHIEFPVNITYEIEPLTEVCGFEVWFRLKGTFKGILFRNKAGTIGGEFNSQPRTWLILYSPETGNSIRNPFATTFHYRYPEGTDPGDRAIITATGFLEKLPGLPARAGRVVFPHGEVLFLDDGVPIVDYGEPSSETRGISKYSGDEADAAICDALAP